MSCSLRPYKLLFNLCHVMYVGNNRLFLSQFRQRLYDVYKQEWRIQISETSQHRLYMHIKQDFCFESYLSIVNKELRIHISKLKLSSHLFLVERGRWVNRRLNIVMKKYKKNYV